MLLSTLAASLLENLLSDKGVKRPNIPGQGVIRAGQGTIRVGEGTIRAYEGTIRSGHDFQCSLIL